MSFPLGSKPQEHLYLEEGFLGAGGVEVEGPESVSADQGEHVG